MIEPAMFALLLMLLTLLAVVGGACFYAGRRSATSHLTAATDVANITNAAIDRTNAFGSSLDKYAAEAASLRASIDSHTKSTLDRQGGVEDAVRLLIASFEASGLVRTTGGKRGLQVGEKGPEQS